MEHKVSGLSAVSKFPTADNWYFLAVAKGSAQLMDGDGSPHHFGTWVLSDGDITDTSIWRNDFEVK